MSNPISTTTSLLFLLHIFRKSKDGGLSTTEEFQKACSLYPGADLNGVDEDGCTVWHVAAVSGNVFLINTIL